MCGDRRVKHHAAVRALRRTLTVLCGVLLLMVVFAGWGYYSARADPIVRRATISLPHWPTGKPPITVALLSDIHIGSPATDAARLARVVDQINALHPDLVLIAGDFIAGHEVAAGRRYAAQLTRPLAKLHARLGTVAVLGNHDHWTSPEAVRTALQAAGIRVLANEAVERGPVAVVGIDDGYTGHADVGTSLAAANSLSGARIVLSHTPDTAKGLPPGSAALVLAGHTHCGQAMIPLIGPAVINSPRLHRPLYEPRYRCGIIRDPGRIVVVTGGIGASLPLRYSAPPDIWLMIIGPS